MINYAILTFRLVWLCFPRRARELRYQLLLKAGAKMYRKTLPYQRVPFRLYIKRSLGRVLPCNEGPALRLVEQYTDVPAPTLIDSLKTNNRTYLVVTHPPGETLGNTMPRLTYAERSQLSTDLRACISQFRKIPNPNNASICSADGGPAFDYRLGDPAGLFDSEQAFNKHIISQSRLRSEIHDHRHEIFFSHADLNPANILIERGRLSGIVDFRCVKFYPEY